MIATAVQKPLRRDIVQQKVLQMITKAGLKPGDRLLSEKKLAGNLGVNHQTLRAAFSELASKGVLERRPGSGTFIKHSSVPVKANSSFNFDSEKTVVVAMRDDPHFFSGLRNDIVLALEKNGMLPIAVGNSKDFTHENMEQLFRFNAMGASQLVIDQAFVLEASENIKFLREHGAKFDNVVMVPGNQVAVTGMPGSMVLGDYPDAYDTAIAHLKALRHEKIGFFCGTVTEDNADWCANRRYIELYTQAMIKNSLVEGIKIATSVTKEDMVVGVQVLLDAGCSAVFCDNDYRALISLETVRNMGLKVPEDFSVIGFFDTPWAEHYNMTTFRYRNSEIAEEVVRHINHPDLVDKLSLKKIDFIERGTTGKFKKLKVEGFLSK
ncbi:MAG: GntR family transcriptional regulator [Victivallaceae bacterium]|nr:GntR family transcriptional regulator [Victivallaceae bacterium]